MIKYYKDADKWYYAVRFDGDGNPVEMYQLMSDTGTITCIRPHLTEGFKLPSKEITRKQFQTGYAFFIGKSSKNLGMIVRPGVSTPEALDVAKEFEQILNRSPVEKIRWLRRLAKKLAAPAVVMMDNDEVDRMLGLSDD